MGIAAKNIIDEKIVPFVDPGDWQSPQSGEDKFSVNQIIAAYEVGFKSGKDSVNRLVTENFRNNLTNIGKKTESLIEVLRDKNFSPVSAILKIEDWDKFEVLIILPEEELLKDTISEIYEEIGKLIKESTSYFKFDFILAGKNKSFNWKKVSSDGFKLHHKALSDA